DRRDAVALGQREVEIGRASCRERGAVVGRVGVGERAAVDRRRIGEGGPWIIGRDGEGQAEAGRSARGQRRTRRAREHAGGNRAARVGGRASGVGRDRILHHHPRRHRRRPVVRQGDRIGGRGPGGDRRDAVALGQREVGHRNSTRRNSRAVASRDAVGDWEAVDRRRIGEGGPWIIGRDGEGQAGSVRGYRGQRRSALSREHAGGHLAARVLFLASAVTPELFPLSLHDALPIWPVVRQGDRIGGRGPGGDRRDAVALGQREV